MTTDVVPILRVADAAVAAGWYRRLGFERVFEHRFEADLPAYVGLRREGAQLHLSEHAGDAHPFGLIYVWVDDVDTVAEEFEIEVVEQPWAREVQLVDPDGNRVRVAQASTAVTTDDVLGEGTAHELLELTRAMWAETTRGDRAWMTEHLTETFTEFGQSGLTYSRDDILEIPVGPIGANLSDLAVRSLGRDAALVTYRSHQTRGIGNRCEMWVRQAGVWRLDFSQGTPAAD
jgi:hypothetical protein